MYKFCPHCGESLEEEVDGELTPQDYESPEDIARDRHEKTEHYRRQHYKKKGWKFTPNPFIFEEEE